MEVICIPPGRPVVHHRLRALDVGGWRTACSEQRIGGTGQRICINQSETKWQLGSPNIPCRIITKCQVAAFMNKYCQRCADN